MPLTLVILAGGLGSRFGGPKQLEPVSPGGATLMDYAVYDAARAGFGKVVVVVRPDLEDDVRRKLEQRYGRRLHATTVLQRMDDVPAGRVPVGRTTPWGTAHAVLAARYAVRHAFMVVNADDFYGLDAYAAGAEFLRSLDEGQQPPVFGLAGYRLMDTLSPHGGVNRAVCRTASDGYLKTIEEVRAISLTGEGVLRGLRTSGSRVLTGDEIVSMNCWAFTAAVFPLMEKAFVRFLTSRAAAKGELLIPEVISTAVAAGEARVRVLDAGRSWFGLTHAADTAAVRAVLQRLINSGEYPERPWD